MRQIGHVPTETDARRLEHHLTQQGIPVHLDEQPEGWGIWVREEDHRERATEELTQYLADPQASRYELPAPAAPVPTKRRRSRRVGRAARSSRHHRRPRLRSRPTVVLFLIALSVAVTMSNWFGRVQSDSLGYSTIRTLSFADRQAMMRADSDDPFYSVRTGEAWRLITPIFLHFDWEHILFNMVMFYYLGAQLERLQGPLRLGVIVVLVAVVSNVAQAAFEGPAFGGMSGVVYGLLGYVWMKASYEPHYGYALEPLLFVLALAWFFMCLFNAFEDTNVANYAHAGGLVAGIVVGIAPVLRRS
jgi:GlpG protein